MKLVLKLLYQFRVMADGSPGIFRRCEERYIVIPNVVDVFKSLDDFFAQKNKRNHSFISTAGHKVYCEFVGVMDYIIIDNECDEEEFWYDFCVKKLPMENKKKLTLSKREIKKQIRQKEKYSSPLKPIKPRLEPHVSLLSLTDSPCPEDLSGDSKPEAGIEH